MHEADLPDSNDNFKTALQKCGLTRRKPDDSREDGRAIWTPLHKAYFSLQTKYVLGVIPVTTIQATTGDGKVFRRQIWIQARTRSQEIARYLRRKGFEEVENLIVQKGGATL